MKPRLLDLFCGAGGAAVGYARAGFEVVGIDINPQPHYPFRFIQDDAMRFPLSAKALGFDAIHASPPCQGYSVMRNAPGAVGAERMIGRVRRRLLALGLPFVIENVEGARGDMLCPVTLCGSMFGLGARGFELRRHRLFEVHGFDLKARHCRHGKGPVVGVYGGHARVRAASHGGRGTRDAWNGGHRGVAAEAMGMPWGTLAEMSEAVPPAYTEFIGRALYRKCVSEAPSRIRDVDTEVARVLGASPAGESKEEGK